MKHHIIIATLTAFILLTSFNIGRKVNLIYIKDALKSAKSIQLIKVYGYTDTSLLYGTEHSVDTFQIKSKRGGYINLKKVNKIRMTDGAVEFGGKWPSVGQNVLMVVDSTNLLNLLAFRVKDDYRFWDPNSIPFANSIFIIPNETPFKRLPICLQVTDSENKSWSCTDGCLVNAMAIKLKN